MVLKTGVHERVGLNIPPDNNRSLWGQFSQTAMHSQASSVKALKDKMENWTRFNINIKGISEKQK